MKKLLISILDQKAETWSVPVASDTKASALRDFGSLVNDSRTLIGQHPEDFDLFVVGTFAIDTGLLEPSQPVHLANGIDLKPKAQE